MPLESTSSATCRRAPSRPGSDRRMTTRAMRTARTSKLRPKRVSFSTVTTTPSRHTAESGSPLNACASSQSQTMLERRISARLTQASARKRTRSAELSALREANSAASITRRRKTKSPANCANAAKSTARAAMSSGSGIGSAYGEAEIALCSVRIDRDDAPLHVVDAGLQRLHLDAQFLLIARIDGDLAVVYSIARGIRHCHGAKGRFDRFGEPEPHFVRRGSRAPHGRNGVVKKGMRLRRRGEHRAKYADEGDAEKHTRHLLGSEGEFGEEAVRHRGEARRRAAVGQEDLHLRWSGKLSTACGHDHQIAPLSVSATLDELPDRADRIDDRRPRRVRRKGLQRLQRARA